MKTRIFLSAASVLIVVVATTTALAGHVASGVKSYTGCLSVNGGTLTMIKEGDAPEKTPCPSGSVEAHFSGGDITSITAQAGGGLSGGGTNGAVSLSIRRDCANGQVLKWNATSSAWGCASDSDSTYTAGTGLDLNGSEFSIEPDYQVKNTPDCASGQFATGFDSSGTIQCAAPAAPAGSAVRITYQPSYTFAGPDFERIVSTSLPEGTYALTARADLAATVNGGDDFIWRIACELRDGSTRLGGAEAADYGTAPGFSVVGIPNETLTLVGVVSVPAGGKEVSLWCKNAGSREGSLGPYGADLMSVKVGGSF